MYLCVREKQGDAKYRNFEGLACFSKLQGLSLVWGHERVILWVMVKLVWKTD